MSIHFPFEIIPNHLKVILGEFDKETRSYHAYGEEGEVGYWYEAIIKALGPIVSPGGVSMYVPVSRTAIRKRIKEARFTVFYFHSKPASKGLFFNKRVKRESAYVFIPVSECRAWASEIEAKMIRLGHATVEEIDDERPDWYDYFHDSMAQDDFWFERKMELDEKTAKHAETIGRRESHSEMLKRVYEKMQSELRKEQKKDE